MKDKNKLIKFVRKHPNLSTFLIGAGAFGTGMAIPQVAGFETELARAIAMPTIGGGAIAMTKGEIQAIESYLKKHYGKKKMEKVI
jgi:hypothetical protein